MSIERAQEDKQLWHAWKANPMPDTLNPLMHALKPVIKSEANKWKQTGINPALLEGQASELAFEALHTYSPDKAQLNTHVTNHLQKMNRYVIENQQAVRVQEAKVFEFRKYNREKENLSAELGHEPDSQELAKHFSNSGSIASYKPLIEHFYSKNVETGGSAPVMEELSMHATAMSMMYDHLNDKDKKVFERAYGYNGVAVIPKKDIAKQMGVSAAAISKQLRKIEKTYQDHVNAADSFSSGYGKSGSSSSQSVNRIDPAYYNQQSTEAGSRLL